MSCSNAIFYYTCAWMGVVLVLAPIWLGLQISKLMYIYPKHQKQCPKHGTRRTTAADEYEHDKYQLNLWTLRFSGEEQEKAYRMSRQKQIHSTARNLAIPLICGNLLYMMFGIYQWEQTYLPFIIYFITSLTSVPLLALYIRKLKIRYIQIIVSISILGNFICGAFLGQKLKSQASGAGIKLSNMNDTITGFQFLLSMIYLRSGLYLYMYSTPALFVPPFLAFLQWGLSSEFCMSSCCEVTPLILFVMVASAAMSSTGGMYEQEKQHRKQFKATCKMQSIIRKIATLEFEEALQIVNKGHGFCPVECEIELAVRDFKELKPFLPDAVIKQAKASRERGYVIQFTQNAPRSGDNSGVYELTPRVHQPTNASTHTPESSMRLSPRCSVSPLGSFRFNSGAYSPIHPPAIGGMARTEATLRVARAAGKIDGERTPISRSMVQSMELYHRNATVLMIKLPYLTASTLTGIGLNQLQDLDAEFVEEVFALADENEGVVYQFGGGIACVVFNGFSSCPQHETQACMYALKVCSRLSGTRFKIYRRGTVTPDGPDTIEENPKTVSISITSGPIIAGFTGSSTQKTQTVIGPTTDICSRLVALNKKLNCKITISESVYQAVQHRFDCNIVDKAFPEGSQEPIMIYQLVSDCQTKPSEASPNNRALSQITNSGDTLNEYKNAFACMVQGRYKDAECLFMSFVESAGPKATKSITKACGQAARLLQICSNFQPTDSPYVRKDGWENVGPAHMPTQIRSFLRRSCVMESHENDVATRERSDIIEEGTPPISKTCHDASVVLNMLMDQGSPRDIKTETASSETGSSVEDEVEEWPVDDINSMIKRQSELAAETVICDSKDKDEKEAPLEQAQHMHTMSRLRSMSQLSYSIFRSTLKNQSMNHMAGEYVDPSDSSRFRDIQGTVWDLSDTKLGGGGFGEVFLGMSQTGLLVAIKKIKLAGDYKQLLEEIRHLSNYKHLHIVAYLGCAVLDQVLHVVMEYVSCGSLATVLRNFGKLALSSTRKYSRDIVKGLAYLHSHKVLHRDIKPANVLLEQSGCCKLADFGTAGAFSGTTNEIVGTPYYMSPELVQGHVSTAVDIWAFGVSVLQLLTGFETKFLEMDDKTNDIQIMYTLATLDHNPTIPPGVHEEALPLICACMNFQAEGRPSANELLNHSFFL